MSGEEEVEKPGLMRLPVSRRDIIRISGGTALAAVAFGSLGLSAGDGAPAEARPGSDPAGLPVQDAGTQMRLVANSAQLLIRDGSPNWWLSPDIWVVPGTDPNGPAGSPIAGGVAYVWAHVANTGQDDALGVQVKFYWANPSVQMLYSGINLIGTSLADIPAGGSQDVLCLVPWNVVTVNGGHECLVVVASMPSDPPLPDAVDPVGYPNVAQRNLTVLSALWKNKQDFHLTVTVSAAPRQDKKVQISSELGTELPSETLASLGLKQGRPAAKQVVQVGLSLKPITDPGQGIGEPTVDVAVPAGRSVPLYVTVRGTGPLNSDEYQVVHVIERQDKQVLGGISFVAVAE